MDKDKPSKIFLLILLGAFLLYLLYLFLIWLGKVYVFLGYNSFFFLDNLLAITLFNPVVMWGVFGLFIGSMVGIIIAVKKFKLNYNLVFYPLTLVILFLSLLGFINKPAEFYGNYNPPLKLNNITAEPIEPSVPKNFYSLKTMVNVRTGPTTFDSIIFTLQKGTEVELVKKGFYNKNRNEWFKIKYKDQEGYVNSKFLKHSRFGY